MSSTAGPSQIAGSASAPQFRTFTSFDIEEVRDVEDETQSPAFIRSLRPPVVVTPTSAHSPLEPSLILSSSTHITILDRHFTPTRTFRAWEENGKCTALIEAGGLLVGIGEDEGSRYPVLKIWDLTRDEKRRANSGPVLMRNVRIQHGQRPHPVSAIALTSNLSHLAIGLGDGTVLLYRHLLQSLSTSPTALTSLPKARVIHESPEPVTGLGFREATPTSRASAPDSDKANAGQLSLFVVTTNRVLCASASGRGGDARTIDERGAGLGCACMSCDRSELIVARDEGIDLYGPGGRGRCYAYEGPKSSVAVYRHNLIITSPSFIPTANSASATVRNHVKKDPTNGSDIAKVTVFDIMNSIITYSGTFREGVRGVFFQWGEIFVLGSDSKLSRLDEHSTSAKLEVLYKRNQYKLAIQLAESQGMGDAGMADIRRKYGDYLYTKGDFDGSTDQFVQTLGHLQPSYVIRKFLDAQRIPNLTEYLQQLHERGLANPDHTTLLLNCYTKTGDRDKLDSFLKAEVGKSGASSTSVDIDELPFDLDTAIRVCRQAGFYEHASYLAKRWGRHEDYLRIQIEDAEKYEEALEYLRSLGHAACQENLDIYGRALLQHEPTVTTELLIDLCSGQLGRRPTKKQPAKSNSTEEPKANGASGPAMLSYLGVNKVTGLFLGDASSTAAGPTSPTVETNGKDEVSGIQHTLKEATLSEDLNHYVPPSPQTYFAHFVDHPDHFVAFLEAVAQNLWSQSSAKISTSASNGHAERRAIEVQQTNEPGAQDQQAVWNTLLELYLSPADPSIGTRSKQYEERALAILRDSGKKYDPVHALILCSTAGFNEGMVDLWESMGMYEDILRFYMETPTDSSINPNARHPSDEVLRYLDVYGPDHHHLYPLALRYLTSSPEIVSRQSSAIPRILQIIDEEHILPPLAVVQLLSRNGVASVGLVKEWLRAKVSETRQDVESDKHLVESYRNETKEKEGQLKTLADPTAPETFQVTRCASCSGQLDLPSVHFMCKHSYHQRCLSDSEPECILCARQHSIIREVRRGQTRLADRHDLFVNEVHEAEDGFAVVAGAFGRGLMGRQITSAPS